MMSIREYYTSDEYELKAEDIRLEQSIAARKRIYESCHAVLEDSPKVILDIGCGNGIITKHFLRKGNIVIGLEINKKLAQQARMYFNVILGDAERPWPIRDESVDVIYMGAFLEHVFDYDFILSEAHRVLRNNGSLVILVPNGVNLKDRLLMLFGKQPGWYKIKGHIRFWTLPWLRKILYEHGFKEKYVYGFPFPTREWLSKFKIFNPIYDILERKFPGLCKLILWKGYKV